MAAHRQDEDIAELQTYFDAVIDWVSSVFPGIPDKEKQGLEWGRLYEEYGGQPYSPAHMGKRVLELRADEAVDSPRGIYEYLLGGEEDTRLLSIRYFEPSVIRVAYETQTAKAKDEGMSNCPVWASGHEAGSTRIWPLSGMDADHVTAWSKGGPTDASNCQMLCKWHNRAKGNR